MGRIVVGVDESEQARRALEWAISEARMRNAELVVLHVFDPYHMVYPLGGASMVAGDMLTAASVPGAAAGELDLQQHEERLAREAESFLDRLIADTGARDGGLEVEREAVPAEHAAGVLIDRSRDADLLVVGSRGRGGFTGLLLGSVSQQCVQHAASPVTVIPAGS